MGLFDEFALSNKVNKLTRYRTDLCDDSSAIQNYNRKIDAIISDYQSFVKTGYSAVTDKLPELKEPYQHNDNNLLSARNYIQYEINSLNRQAEGSSGNGHSGGGIR